jgi:hypothetical protein
MQIEKGFAVILLLALILLGGIPSGAETIRVNPNDPTIQPPEQLKPGFHYCAVNPAGDAVFNTSPIRYNCVRDADLEWYLRTSTSHSDFLSRVRSARSYLERRAAKTDRMVLELSGMPYWCSRSKDSTIVGGNWRYFMTVGPEDFQAWDALMTDLAAEIATWSFVPTYEFWNEPDLFYWNDSEGELIQLYCHTANAIKAVDPDAKIGGVAMNGWWKGVDPSPGIVGYIPDSLVERYSTTAHLIDTCADTGTPLDFVSWHLFMGTYPGMIDHSADFYRRKLDSRGLTGAEMFVTEYNTTSSTRETMIQPPLFARYYDHMARAGVDAHTMATFQDFSYDPNNEFFHDYGSLSRGGLCKPVYNAILLVDSLQKNSRLLPVETEGRITAWASREGTTLRLLLANAIAYPLWVGYDTLYFGGRQVNNLDLVNAGYTRNGQVDSTIMGYYPPIGPPRIVEAFEAANAAYTWSVPFFSNPRPLDLRFTGLEGTYQGTIYIVDTSHNNVIAKYDSLLNAGYTRQDAVNYLYADQSLSRDTIQVTDSLYSLAMPPNSVYLLTLYDIPQSGVASGPAGLLPSLTLTLYPNPGRGQVEVRFPEGLKDLELGVYDVTGRAVAQYPKPESGTLKLNGLPPGIYFLRLKAGARSLTRKLVVIK